MKILTFLLFLLFSGLSFSQQYQRNKYTAFSGSVVLSMEGGATLGFTDYKNRKVDYMGRGSVEYFFPSFTKSSFGIRAMAGGGYIRGEEPNLNPNNFRTSILFAGGGLVYTLSLSNVVNPYLFAGAAYTWFDPRGENDVKLPNNLAGVYKKRELNYIGEIGIRFLATDNLSFNLGGGVQLSNHDYLDDIAVGTNKDLFFSALAGASFSFFITRDSDGDGVDDSEDLCGDTPPHIKVDEFGCPIDSDKDGVPDYLDKCPNTPKDVLVNNEGCPLDSDGDGVPDYLDLCSNTPNGIAVDKFGCPLDHDGDGIPDYKDKCSNTPAKVEVDENGCPLDSDKDGVPDYLDNCPGTAVGTKVDENGCPIEKESKEYTLSAGANFAFGSSSLLPSAYPELDKLVEAMKQNPLSRWRIEGHTDNIGSRKGNLKISRERAEAVLNYFISKGLVRNRFEVFGMGMDYPVADNSTETGRAKNRRVVIIRIN
jgi:outer membrane protein OmpA-like peptidoglycan-associated protein